MCALVFLYRSVLNFGIRRPVEGAEDRSNLVPELPQSNHYGAKVKKLLLRFI